ncbi:MAG: glycosyltransferase family 39 protein, partial [bacterium]
MPWVAGAVVLVALGFRLFRLGDRPMHGDEAVQAVKAWELHATGRLAYDPAGFHGLTLAWLVQPVFGLARARTFAGTDEWMYRLPPALAGAALAALPWAFAGIEPGVAVVAGLLAAVSPALVYYSRDAIQEMVFVFLAGLALAAGWRVARTGARGWLVGSDRSASSARAAAAAEAA